MEFTGDISLPEIKLEFLDEKEGSSSEYRECKDRENFSSKYVYTGCKITSVAG